MISVRLFKGLEDVMEYYETLSANNTFLDLRAGQEFFIMAKKNFAAFYKDQDVEKYETFMKKAYN